MMDREVEVGRHTRVESLDCILDTDICQLYFNFKKVIGKR